MIFIGNHLSSSDGYLAMGKAASKLGANTFAFFTRNPRGGTAKEIDPADAQALNDYLKEHSFGKLVAHAPYTMNLCSDKPDIRVFAKNMLIDDLKRMEATPNQYYNFHPGSHVGQGVEETIPVIAGALNDAMFAGMTTTVLLETMAGKGTEVGKTFEEVAYILNNSKYPSRLGVCLDTCHINDAGYDVSNVDKVLDEFDKVIGLNKLKAIHLNDSKNARGSHKDRHENIGFGTIGFDTLNAWVKHEALKNVPKILETPYINDKMPYKEEIEMLKEGKFNPSLKDLF